MKRLLPLLVLLLAASASFAADAPAPAADDDAAPPCVVPADSPAGTDVSPLLDTVVDKVEVTGVAGGPCYAACNDAHFRCGILCPPLDGACWGRCDDDLWMCRYNCDHP